MKQYDNKEIIALVCATVIAVADIIVEAKLTAGAAALVSAAMGYVFGKERRT